MTDIEKHNKELIETYPFLAFKEYDFDNDTYYIPDNYDYNKTWLDVIPEGWRKAFGLQLCEEMKATLDEYEYTDKYIITDIKEKYGFLHLYDNGIPQGCKVWDVIDKYAKMSMRICIGCGAPATVISKGWISPWCDECARELCCRFWPIDKH